MSKKIFKIVNQELWNQAKDAGVFKGAEIDLTDGYIHFSAEHQVKETAAKHFQGQSDLLLVTVEAERLGENLKWEASRGGDLFPHLYGDLELSLVDTVEELPLGSNGAHEFPSF